MFYRKLLKELEIWRQSSLRKPLVIRGARQVGKTTLVHEFGKQYEQYIYLNLEEPKDSAIFDDYRSMEDLKTRIFLEKRMQLDKIQDTLLFIDEIQESPKVVNLLRYFKEQLPELQVIAAGSMLETLLGKNITFPVGRVEYKILRPVSFEEYLKVMGEEQLFEAYKRVPIESYAEPVLLRAFHTYALLGGMPEVIQHYKEHKDITALGSIYDSLISSYLQDAEKYAKTEKQLHLIRFSIHQAMLKAGKRTTFQRFGNSNYSSKDIGEVLRALQKTHLLHIMYPVTSCILPLEPDYNKTPRIQFLDSGMVNYFVGLQNDIIATDDLDKVYQGTLIEHLVGQELLSIQTLTLQTLQFWVRQKKQSDAEIDFIYPYKGKLIPIEVKSGATGTLKSLHVFMDQSPIHFAIRFYAGKMHLMETTTRKGKRFHLLSLPYFLVCRIEDYIDWLMNEVGEREIEPQIVEESKAVYVKKRTNKEYTLSDLTEKHFQILEYCSQTPRKGKEIIEDLLGLTYQSRNKRVYIKPLMDLGLLEFTNKEYEKSKEQRYQLTQKGKRKV